MRLVVELYGTTIGHLEGDPRTFDFTASAEGIERFGINNQVLSVAIPLTPHQRRDHAARRRNWFAELLPEGDQYNYMLAQSGLRPGDSLGFLARYGRDVAGALQIWDADDPTEPKTPLLNPVTDSEIRIMLEDPIRNPLGNDPLAGKSSLGGVQPKIVLAQMESGWAQALSGFPTTHILKPILSNGLESTIFDEEYGSRIARGLGLLEFDTKIHQFDGLDTLVIQRYDRLNGLRIHQEDFNQALGAAGNEKYQEIGGVVSLQRVASVLRRHAAGLDLHRFAEIVVLAVAIGNLDMHTKNLGLLHEESGEIRLAPAYDVVPQAHMHNDGKLALAVNKKYQHKVLDKGDLSAEIDSWGLRNPEELVDKVLENIAAIIEKETPLAGAYSSLQNQIKAFVQNLRTGKRVGDA